MARVVALLPLAFAVSALLVLGQAGGQGLQCERIPRCLDCEMQKDDNSKTIRVCTLCAPGFQPSADYGRSCVCAAGYYWNPQVNGCAACPRGMVCVGSNAAPRACGTGLTTLNEGSSTASQCVALPGYEVVTTRLPFGDTAVGARPCAAATYSLGVSETCRPCPASRSSVPRSGAIYEQCFGPRANTGRRLMAAHARPKKPELVCPPGQVGFSSTKTCYDEWQVLKKDYDYLPVTDAGIILTPVPPPAVGGASAASESWCQSQCKANCLFYIYNTWAKAAPGSKCMIYNLPTQPPPGISMGLKVDEGVYLVVPTDDRALKIGSQIGQPSVVRSEGACSQKCDGIEGCVVFITRPSASGLSCSLREGALDVDYRTKYKVSNTSLVTY